MIFLHLKLLKIDVKKLFISFICFLSVLPCFAEENSIIIPKEKTIPINVSYYIDKDMTLTCSLLNSSAFTPSDSCFNPAFYDGVLWLDITFEDYRKENGTSYILDFGSEYLDYAELYILQDNIWTFAGRTGNNLLQNMKSIPTWRLYIPVDIKELTPDNVHHMRVKMKSSLGSPVILRLATSRDYNRRTSTLTIFHFLLVGVFLFIAFFMIFYGITFKDNVYIYLSISTFLFLILQLQVTGLGQNFFWSFMSLTPYGPKLLYITDAVLTYFLSMTFMAILKEEHASEESLKLIRLIHFFILIDLFITFFIKSDLASSISFNILNIICCMIFISIIGVNTIGNPSLRIQMLFQIPAFILITCRQIFYLVRSIPDNPFYTIYSRDYFFSNYAIFALIEIPPIYLTAKRLYLKFQFLSTEASFNKKTNQKLTSQIDYYNELANKLLDLNYIVRNSIQLPYRSDTIEAKENSKIIEMSIVQSTDMLCTICSLYGRNTPKTEPVLLKSFIDSCIDTVKPVALRKQNIFESYTDIEDNTIVLADPNILEFIISDFILTIIKFSPKNTLIKINIKSQGTTLNCSITNEMINDELKSMKKLLRDKDIDYSKKTKYKTLFMSFNLVKKGIEYYNGKLDIESNEKGYTFKFNMSFDKATKSSKSLQVIDTNLISKETRNFREPDRDLYFTDNILSVDDTPVKILLIEENSQNTSFLSSFLSRYCILSTVNTGLEAWNYLHTSSISKPSYIITEYDLPFLSGIELYRKCSKEDNLKNIPFVFILPAFQSYKKTELLQKGISQCIVKPFEPQELLNILISLKNISEKTHNTFISQLSTVISTKSDSTLIPQENFSAARKISETSVFSSYNLSSREQQIALLILEGKSDKEIASALNISPGTVASHNKNIFKKLDIHSRVELMNKLR